MLVAWDELIKITFCNFEKLSKELEDKAPLFQLVLKAASLRTQDTSTRAIQSIGVAAAVCLKSRSKNMIALQLILAIINNLSGFMVINILYLFFEKVIAFKN